MREPVARLCRLIGYEFSDEGLARTALTHRSAGRDNNERLEFLGDAILGSVVAEALFARFPEADEGQLSRLRAGLVKRDALAGIARELDLGDFLLLGPGELRSGGQQRGSILADALEAILAAVYIDGGHEEAREVILRLLAPRLAGISHDGQQKDPKTRLQELLQARRQALPDYRVTSVAGEAHDQTFTVTCRLEAQNLSASATGSSRRKAEQAAALNILERIQ